MTTPDTKPDIAADYPAAHSMDTTWWGVDQHGHVAQFNSGEAGAVPDTGRQEGPYADAVVRTIVENPSPAIVFYADDLFDAADGQVYRRGWRARWDEVERSAMTEAYANGYLLWLRDEAAINELQPPPTQPSLVGRIARAFEAFATNAGALASQPPWSVLRLPTVGKVVVWVLNDGRHLSPSVVRDWLSRGVALRAYAYDRDLELERFGIFVYEHDDAFENWVSGPYSRGAAPACPVLASSLPPATQQLLEPAPLPQADFVQAALVQPFEHLNSYSWGEGEWISTTGQRMEGQRTAQETPPIPVLSARFQRPLVRLLASYLSLEPFSTEVLSDYLEESQQARMDDAPDSASRLTVVLSRFFSADDLWQLEADFVEHALSVGSPSREERAAAQQAIDAVREARRNGSHRVNPEFALAALYLWRGDNAEGNDIDETRIGRSPLAWAAWALARRIPLVPMRTCRVIDPAALTWQIEHTLQWLDGLPAG